MFTYWGRMSPCVSRQPGTFTSTYPASSKRDDANAGGMCEVCQCSSVLSIGNRSRCDGTTRARHTPSSDCRNVPDAPSTVMWSVCAGNRLTAKTAGSTSQRTLGWSSRVRSPPVVGAMSPFPAASEAVPRGVCMCVVVSDCAIPAPHRSVGATAGCVAHGSCAFSIVNYLLDMRNTYSPHAIITRNHHCPIATIISSQYSDIST